MIPLNKLIKKDNFLKLLRYVQLSVLTLSATVSTYGQNVLIDSTFFAEIKPFKQWIPQPAEILGLAERPNGNLITAGDLVALAGWENAIELSARGTFSRGLGEEIEGSPTEAVSLLPDGATLRIASQKLLRTLPSGEADLSFHPPSGAFGSEVAVQSDGKILISLDGSLVRLLPHGDIDSSFSSVALDGSVEALLVLPTDKILVGGNFTKVNGVPYSGLVRLESTGTIDASMISPNLSGSVPSVKTLALRENGSYIIGGDFRVSTQSLNGLALVTPAGLVSPFSSPLSASVVSSMAQATNGSLYLAGSTGFALQGGSSHSGIIRLDATNAVDTGYRPDSSLTDRVWLQENGQLLAAGVYSPPLQRYQHTGAASVLELQASNGLAIWKRAPESPDCASVWFEKSEDEGLTWTRWASGQRTTNGWRSTVVLSPFSGQIRAVGLPAVSSHGSFIVSPAVASTPSPKIDLRTTAGQQIIHGGVLSFGIVTPGSSQSLVLNMANVGSTSLNLQTPQVTGEAASFLSILLPSPNAVNPSLKAPLQLTLAPNAEAVPGPWVAEVSIPSNDLLTPLYSFRIEAEIKARLGVKVPSFVGSSASTVWAAVPDGENRWLIGRDLSTGEANTATGLIRVLNDGSLDQSFAAIVNGPVYAISVQTDGSIFIGGAFQSVNGQAKSRLARLQRDGTLDQSFTLGASSSVYCLATDETGGLWVGGEFTQIGGVSRQRLARLSIKTGQIDLEIAPALNSYTRTLLPLGGNQVIYSGAFTSVNGNADLAYLSIPTSYEFDGTVRTIVPFLGTSYLVGGSFSSRLIKLDKSSYDSDPYFRPEVTSTGITAINVAANQKMVIAGQITTIAGQPGRGLAQLSATGQNDATFNALANGDVYSLCRTIDGKVMIGGAFTMLAGMPHSNIALLTNEEGNSTLLVQNDGRLTWRATGSAPVPSAILFEYQKEGEANWNTYARQTIDGTWRSFTNTPLIAGMKVRARGVQRTGTFGGSEGFITIETTVSGTSYSLWASSHALTNEVALPDAVLQPDGWPNLVRYAFGLSPHSSTPQYASDSAPGLPQLSIPNDPQQPGQLRFWRRRNASVSYTVQTASSLADPSFWQDVAPLQFVVSDIAEHPEWELLSVPISNSDQENFVRVKVVAR